MANELWIDAINLSHLEFEYSYVLGRVAIVSPYIPADYWQRYLFPNDLSGQKFTLYVKYKALRRLYTVFETRLAKTYHYSHSTLYCVYGWGEYGFKEIYELQFLVKAVSDA